MQEWLVMNFNIIEKQIKTTFEMKRPFAPIVCQLFSAFIFLQERVSFLIIHTLTINC